MADSILRLKVESQEYDAKLKRAAQGLQQYADGCRKAGGTLEVVEKETLDFVKTLGSMETTSKTARGSLNEMTKTFTDLKMQYKQLTDAEKASPYGKALIESLNQLKSRIKETQNDLKSINHELQGGDGRFGQFGSILDGIGQKMGINANITELLTSRTALLTGAIGAGTTAVVAATKAWADYNSELAKQDQITTVTTGLKGDDANRMTDSMRALSDTYNVDFREAVNAANTLMSQFGVSGDEAIRLIKDGMKGMIQGDGPKLLSMIQQYAPAFRDAGVSASQLVAVIQNSEGGIFTDQNMQAIVMGIKNIRLMTKATSDALKQMGIDGEEMSRQLSDGSLTIFDALKQIAGAIRTVDSNSKVAGEVMQQVFGRQGAMAGTNLGKAIAQLNTNLEDTKKQTGEVGDAYNDLYEANVRLNKIVRECFGYDGWEQMATGLKIKLVNAMSAVLEKVDALNKAFKNTLGVSYFEGVWSVAKKALGPIANILSLIRQINKEESKGGAQSSKTNKNYDYIRSGSTRQEREQRYDKYLADINNNLRHIGEEKTRVDDKGRTHYYIDSPEEQQRQRQQLLKERSNLVRNRIGLLAGNPKKHTDITSPTTYQPQSGHKSVNGKSESERADEKVATAYNEYEQAIEQAKMALENGTSTDVDYKKKLLSAEERLWEALGDAYNIHKDPKYKQAQDECAAKIKQLGGEVTASVEAQKKAQEASRELERAQKRLADAHRKLADAEGSGKYKDIVAARKEVNTAQAEVARLETVKVNVEPGNIELPDVPKEIAVPIKYTNENLDVFKAELKEKLNGAEVGSQVFKDLTAQLADVTTLGNLMQTAIKNGIDISQFNPQDLWSKVFGDNPGDYIDDKTWDDLVKTINDELKKRGINGISIDKNTGSLGGTAQKKEVSITKELGAIVGGVSSISNGVRGLGIEIPQGVQNVLNGMQSILSVLSGIATIVTAIQTISTAQMFKPFRNGGVVHAAGGYVVPGNYGYDAVPSLLTSGELVLNKAQQGVLASYLNNDNRGGREIVSHPYVTGETIVLGANNYLKSRGQGEIVTTRMLKNMIR